MEKQPPEKVWTYDDLVALQTEEMRRHEILDGELVVSPSPIVRHQRVVANLFALLRPALQETRIAEVFASPVDVILAPTLVLIPDVVAVAAGRRHLIARHGIVGPPDLVIEILSPSNARYDRVRKRRAYARAGIREYWIVDAESETVEVLALLDGGLTYRQDGFYAADERLTSTVFDLDLAVADVFASPFDDA